MKHTQSTKSHLLTHEMYIKFDVLGTPMLCWVGREVNSAHVITVDNRGTVKGPPELLQNITEPTSLGDGSSNRTVFSLNTRA
jgi:hypothetical protein